jgi:FkbM family methyltransferase
MSGTPDNNICIHHVGGRGGVGTIAIPAEFSKDIVTVLYEADSDAKKSESDGVISLDYCITGSPGYRRFFVNYDPHTSSLLAPDREFASFYLPTGMIDYCWSEATRPAKTLEVYGVTLDDATLDPAVPAPDVLTLDTQGSELEILGGAARLLAQNVLAIVAEVEFQPMYEGQPLFGDVCSFLRDAGFYFVGFDRLGPGMMPYRAPSGLRAEGFLSYGDAVFLRRQDLVTSESQRSKLAFLAIVFKQLEYGLMCLQDVAPAAAPRATYQRFLDELKAAASRHPRLFCPTYAETYRDFAHSVNRNMDAPEFSKARESLKHIPGLVTAVRAVRSLPRRFRAARVPKTTEVETLLTGYGLVALAEQVKEMRLRDAPWARPKPTS